MRNVLLIFGLLVATSLSAQRFELGINGGVGFNGKTKSLTSGTHISTNNKPLNTSDVYSLKGMYSYKNWQFGVSFDHRRATYKIEQRTVFISYFFPTGIQSYSEPIYVHRSRPYYPVKFFANRKVKLNHFELYGGLSAGFVILAGVKPDPTISDLTMDMETRQRTADYHINHGISFTAGAQMGCTYFVSRHIGLNVEVNADYVQFRQGSHMRSQMVSVPIMLGLRYR